jgi:lipopolysaccharide export system protein LptA
MAVARGDAVVVTNDARRISADTLVAYTRPDTPSASAQGSGQSGAAAPGTSEQTPSGTSGSASAVPVKAAAQSANPTGDPTMAMAGKLDHVDAFGNVTVRTLTDIVIGDRGVYVPDTGIAHLGGHVRITRGLNQINGAEAVVNMKTGVATLLSGDNGRVSGLVVPNDQSNPPPGDVEANQPSGTRPKSNQPKPGAKQ